jgi:uncharacterized membrane protein
VFALIVIGVAAVVIGIFVFWIENERLFTIGDGKIVLAPVVMGPAAAIVS